MGGVPRPLPAPQGRPRRLRPGLRNQLPTRAQLRSLPPAPHRPRPAAKAGRHPREPDRPHHRSRTTRLARRSRRAQSQPRRRQRQARPGRRAHRPPRRSRRPRHAGLPPHRRADNHQSGPSLSPLPTTLPDLPEFREAGRADTLFSDDAAALIHTTARGYPRAVNNLALQALVATYAAGKAIVDETAARSAVTEVTDT